MAEDTKQEWTLYVCPRCQNAELRDTMKHRLGMQGYSCRCGYVPMTETKVVPK